VYQSSLFAEQFSTPEAKEVHLYATALKKVSEPVKKAWPAGRLKRK